MGPESRFRRQVVLPFLKTLKKTKFFPIQQVAITATPDYLICVRGRFVGLELKAAGEEPRPLQEYELRQITAADGVALVASPDNWSEIKDVLLKMSGGY